MPSLQSNIIESVAYDQAAHRLRTKFRGSGEVKVYEDVPQEVYDSLIFADSVGGYFLAHVEGRYLARKL